MARIFIFAFLSGASRGFGGDGIDLHKAFLGVPRRGVEMKIFILTFSLVQHWNRRSIINILTHSLIHSLTHSLTRSLPPSLPQSLLPFLPHSLTHSLTYLLGDLLNDSVHETIFVLTHFSESQLSGISGHISF